MSHDKYSVYLRGFKESDTEQINRWRNDRELQALVSAPFRYVPEAIEREWVRSKMLNNRTDIYLAICLKENDEMVGYISINDIDHISRRAHVGGIVLDRKYHDGIIRHEVGMLIRELAFDQLNLNRLEGGCIAEHIASRVAMEATGYILEGVRRQYVYKDGRYHDSCLYSLMREDYYDWMIRGEYSLRSFAKKVKELRKQYQNEK
ncbi:MAG: GNAT family N-acetyltransferase [Muribaculaceae bacterium]|nr:GNAT family N-acetyltransferase [Muribaculaceae bacterium]